MNPHSEFSGAPVYVDTLGMASAAPDDLVVTSVLENAANTLFVGGKPPNTRSRKPTASKQKADLAGISPEEQREILMKLAKLWSYKKMCKVSCAESVRACVPFADGVFVYPLSLLISRACSKTLSLRRTNVGLIQRIDASKVANAQLAQGNAVLLEYINNLMK
ncbi:hypothetical protein HDU83_007876 [Entophlyctis luteolus]|nr:hypothetical protein HDU82_008045 [Entophlyctis luteolus]KAJ3352569.1 hypothetical protein HDU83_007876 [Entophlyctis luteolus]